MPFLPQTPAAARVLVGAGAAIACLATLSAPPAGATSTTPAAAAAGDTGPGPSARQLGLEPIRSPGSFTGYAFDRCISPDGGQMKTWRKTSPFGAVGVYISGSGRACPASAQPSLSPRWVQRQHARGWRILPIHVGRQAPCFTSSTKPRMSSKPHRAHRQGKHAATRSVDKARYYGLGRGSTLYLDIEWYERTRSDCNAAVLAHIDGWTDRVHRLGYRSGLYSSASAAIQALDVARHTDPRRYSWPDELWFAWGNGRADLEGEPYLADDFWASSQRLHQYQLDTAATYGGTTMYIDRNWMSVGKGSRARAQTGTCGRRQSFGSYPRLRRGEVGSRVAAARCLLGRFGYTSAAVTNRYDQAMVRALRRLQTDRGLPVNGTLNMRSWMSLLARGNTPLLKVGSDAQAVWRLQRSLRAAGVDAPLTGTYNLRTASAVRRYERSVSRPVNGVVDNRVWGSLQRGRT